jgi:hypothetical protein
VRRRGARAHRLPQLDQFADNDRQAAFDRGATVESVTAGGQPAFWIGGRPHEVVLLDEHREYVMETLRLEGNVLLWVRNEVTVRIESALSRDEAIQLAESIR